MRKARRYSPVHVLLAAGLALAPWVLAQGVPPTPTPSTQPQRPPEDAPLAGVETFEGQTIRAIRVVAPSDGKEAIERPLDATTDGLVRNQFRHQPGSTLSGETLRQERGSLNRLGRFGQIYPRLEPTGDGRIDIVWVLVQEAIIQDVQSVGNRLVSDEEIRAIVGALANTRVDRLEIDRTARAIEGLYRAKNYYNARVSIDEKELEESGILLFRVREGESVKITDLRFTGNHAFKAKQLRSAVKSNVADPIFRAGLLDDAQLDQDVASLVDFYRDRGHLDARADRRIQPAPNGREAIVTFQVEEGPLYTFRGLRVQYQRGREVVDSGRYTSEQLVGLMRVKPGDVYSVSKIEESLKDIERAYKALGYADVRTERREIRDVDSPQVDLFLSVDEGQPSLVGEVFIIGNTMTQSGVLLREADLRPERPLDQGKVEDARRRIAQTGLVDPDSVRVQIQPPAPGDPTHRDVLIQVHETNTGEFNFGASVDSDAGVVGSFSLVQRNFDIADTPESIEELISGRAFRGGGQRFNLSLRPGDKVQDYSISLTEPSFLDTDYSLGGSIGYRTREFREYDEERYGGRVTLGRRFGTRWSGNVFFRNEWVALSDLQSDSPVDFFDAEDRALVSGLGLNLTRTSVDNRLRPTSGTRLELGVEQVGLLFGDYDFTKLSSEFSVFLPLDRSFEGYTTVLSLTNRIGYIPQDVGDVPVYERYYLGGNSFRGFGSRAVSPIGIRNDTKTLGDESVGGTWSFFLGGELNQPVYEDMVSVVGFVDTGTVLDEVGFDDYRVSVGVGARILVKSLSPIPLAFDLGFPIMREETDRKRLLTFSLDVPF